MTYIFALLLATSPVVDPPVPPGMQICFEVDEELQRAVSQGSLSQRQADRISLHCWRNVAE